MPSSAAVMSVGWSKGAPTKRKAGRSRPANCSATAKQPVSQPATHATGNATDCARLRVAVKPVFFCVSMASACATMSSWLSGTSPFGVNWSMSCGSTCANPPAVSPCDMPSCCAIWPMAPLPSTSCKRAARHGDVLPGALPRCRLVGVAALAKLVEEALHAAVLLQQLQRHLQQRTSALSALAQHAAERAADQSIEHSHGSPRFRSGRRMPRKYRPAAQRLATACLEQRDVGLEPRRRSP